MVAAGSVLRGAEPASSTADALGEKGGFEECCRPYGPPTNHDQNVECLVRRAPRRSPDAPASAALETEDTERGPKSVGTC